MREKPFQPVGLAFHVPSLKEFEHDVVEYKIQRWAVGRGILEDDGFSAPQLKTLMEKKSVRFVLPEEAVADHDSDTG